MKTSSTSSSNSIALVVYGGCETILDEAKSEQRNATYTNLIPANSRQCSAFRINLDTKHITSRGRELTTPRLPIKSGSSSAARGTESSRTKPAPEA